MKKFVLLFFLSLFIACVSTEAIRIGTPTARPVVFWQNVVVYTKADQVLSKYEEIALLTSTADEYITQQGMINSMKKKAGSLGANAIILDAFSEPSDVTKIASALLPAVSAERKGKAMAIFVFPVEKK